MAWVVANRTLTQTEMENNADIIISYYRSLGYSDLTISAILGNMQWESSLSPHRTERRWRWWVWISTMDSCIKTSRPL